MALLISHRGNRRGMNTDKENSLEYVKEALDEGFFVMVDVWLVGGSHVALGHDRPKHPVDLEFLKDKRIVCRARSLQTLTFLLHNEIHCFYFGRDDFSLTTGGLIWTYPGMQLGIRSIFFMPEFVLSDVSAASNFVCAGICSDRIADIQVIPPIVEESLQDKEIIEID